MRVPVILATGLLGALALVPASLSAQRGGMFLGSSEDPAIAYSTAPLNNAVSEISQKLHDGSARLTLEGRSEGYQSLSSDIAALLVLSHQTHMTNLLTRAGWEARAADPSLHAPFVAGPGEQSRIAQMMSGIATEVVDYLLFVDEAPLTDRIRGSSGFAQRFAAAGPHDARGRSLHELDLARRLMKYPCSYLIYSDAFDALPPAAKDPIYRRMWDVLSGEEGGQRYRSALSLEDRQAIVEILRDTKNDLPSIFSKVSR